MLQLMPNRLTQEDFLENRKGLHKQVVQQNMTVLRKNKF